MSLLAAAADDAATVFVEIGAVALLLAALARLASWVGLTAIPFYVLAGLAFGEGGVAPLDVSEEFIEVAAEIGVLLLLLALGLEYSADDLRYGLRTGRAAGVVDALANFTPGFACGLLLGWDAATALLLGGVCWVSSSGVIAKVLRDLDRMGNRETPAVLNLLVLEDLAMAVYLPIAGAAIAHQALGSTVATVAVSLAAVVVVLSFALRWGHRLGDVLSSGSDESLLLALFGLALLVGGLAQRVDVSAAIGAFLVGLALSGPVQERASALIGPLRDLFAAVFFVSFSFQLDPAELSGALGPAALLAVAAIAGKFVAGWTAGQPYGIGPRGRVRAGAALVARGEFSLVIASLGAGSVDGAELGAVAAAFVLLTAVIGSVLARYADRLPLPARLVRAASPPTMRPARDAARRE